MKLNKKHIEELAIKLAEANNGGKWATHYEEMQKDVWRERARVWAQDVINLNDLARLKPKDDDNAGA